MDKMTIEGVIVSPLKVIKVEGGDVFHAMKRDETGYNGFGEAYFSSVKLGAVKAWKRHRKMTLNLVVPVGSIRFVLYDDRSGSSTFNKFQEVTLSRENYMRLTVPPLVWMGFQGVSGDTAIALNISSIPHDPDEADKKAVEEIKYDWSLIK